MDLNHVDGAARSQHQVAKSRTRQLLLTINLGNQEHSSSCVRWHGRHWAQIQINSNEPLDQEAMCPLQQFLLNLIQHQYGPTDFERGWPDPPVPQAFPFLICQTLPFPRGQTLYSSIQASHATNYEQHATSTCRPAADQQVPYGCSLA